MSKFRIVDDSNFSSGFTRDSNLERWYVNGDKKVF